LGLSLQAFAAGAQGYANAYQVPPGNNSVQRNPARTCYTNFIGDTAFTNCY
jgi:hypothetical protein